MKGKNIFRSFAARSLKANKTRTIVTVIGIILSMALFTAVIEGAYSGIMFLVNSEIEAEGDWVGQFYDIDETQYEKLCSADEIKDSVYFKTLGWSESESQNEDKPYLLVQGLCDDFESHVAIHITEGRMPENENEIILPEHYDLNGLASFKVGDTIKLNIGERYVDGGPVNASVPYCYEEEDIYNPQEKEYLIVGEYARFNTAIEDIICPGYMALTRLADPSSETGTSSELRYTAFFTMKNIRNYYKFMDEQTIERYFSNTHSDLLYYNGVSSNSGIMNMLLGLVIILVILIVAGSITLIYNSFSISVSERTKQFGILKSVGATKKQLRSAVLFEAFILAGIGIVIGALVGCIGIGITLYELSDVFTGLLSFGNSTRMQLVINPWAILIAAAICLITVLISAWIPAKRAMKISAMEAIRQNNDVKIKGREVKTSKLTQKLFGIEGTLAAKNFKRSKKKCRSVVLSLTLSIVLFISASSFCAYLIDSIDSYSAVDSGADIKVERYYPFDDMQELFDDLKAIKSVDGIVFSAACYTDIIVDNTLLTAAASDKSYFGVHTIDGDANNSRVNVEISFVDDEEFASLCEKYGVSVDEFTNPDDPKAFLRSQVDYSYYDEEVGYIKYYQNSIIKEQINSCELSMHLTKNDEEYTEKTLKVGRIINDRLYYATSIVPELIYPYSMKEAILDSESDQYSNTEGGAYYIKTKEHADVFETIGEYISDKGLNVGAYDKASSYESIRMLVMIINVFSYGFIILISLIAVANVFNTITTNVNLRRREFAMLRSMGLSNKGFRKMMNFECLIYGFKGIVWGIPISVLITLAIFFVTGSSLEVGFYIPWYSLVISIGSVFLVVFLAMIYSAHKVKKDNPIDALKNENL